jgi:hypothetical protein
MKKSELKVRDLPHFPKQTLHKHDSIPCYIGAEYEGCQICMKNRMIYEIGNLPVGVGSVKTNGGYFGTHCHICHDAVKDCKCTKPSPSLVPLDDITRKMSEMYYDHREIQLIREVYRLFGIPSSARVEQIEKVILNVPIPDEDSIETSAHKIAKAIHKLIGG